ncbi:Uncharacterised protein [Vibrio cholerae]|uniref:Uncharacterized protein n=1 Tax=Vibrio cholerae TaxID=666 RepID=A0A656ACU5_VIBCL|nr:Uncharacterised protein [Vibrio cholerae]CSB91878.1 Uncharacterised protein [Vibrio cholerae]CSC71720.1 Uncharacterised protein [Vibrio cholerae]CSD07573.1 Uncharacterised protein [Vibrio cholerae]CSD26707.1 Uncharacterised protein [Vibrio cholerae]
MNYQVEIVKHGFLRAVTKTDLREAQLTKFHLERFCLWAILNFHWVRYGVHAVNHGANAFKQSANFPHDPLRHALHAQRDRNANCDHPDGDRFREP